MLFVPVYLRFRFCMNGSRQISWQGRKGEQYGDMSPENSHAEEKLGFFATIAIVINMSSASTLHRGAASGPPGGLPSQTPCFVPPKQIPGYATVNWVVKQRYDSA